MAAVMATIRESSSAWRSSDRVKASVKVVTGSTVASPAARGASPYPTGQPSRRCTDPDDSISVDPVTVAGLTLKSWSRWISSSSAGA